MNYIGIKPANIESTVKQLNKLLSNYHIYYQNLRNYHWNISGQHFFELHEKFEELYNDAKVSIDEVAERILTLREQPTSTLKEYLEMAEIEEKSTLDPHEMVKNILSDHKILITNMREAIKCAGEAQDEGTIDLIGGFLATIEKKSWMLDAWIAKS
jgi:starvation-inducible DNA-binding protein